ncbi:MAG: glucose-6-phosphate isomerase [Candidatus Polarisedimenticolia bacterium]
MLRQLGRHEAKVRSTLSRLKRQDFVRRFLTGDPTLWKQDENHARVIRNRMGWMRAAGFMLGRIAELNGFADSIKAAGFKDAVLLGMGGSSLAADVLRRTFRRRPGHPSLHVLDTTDPEAIAEVEAAIDPAKTLFIVASKSGTTIESALLARYFAAKAPPSHFAAITDPGTPLEAEARQSGFRAIFINPPDIGGRYSALSYFGMVPAALLGIDIARLLSRAQQVIDGILPDVPPQDMVPFALGAALGALGITHRDKVTFVLSPGIASFGYWAEQLIAESTGKEGRGLIPVEGEDPGPPSRYGRDRLFVRLKLHGSKEPIIDRRLRTLRAAGNPCITLELDDLYDLGAQFNIWEIATATAGSVLAIDPFDEPNVQESKDNTRRVLELYTETGSLPSPPADLDEGGLRAWAVPPAWKRAAAGGLGPLLAEVRRAAKPGDYIALMAYLHADRAVAARLHQLRMTLRDGCRVATTLGFGPRFLHSTGQLHKGGPANGIFLQITCSKQVDRPIPGQPFTFATLQAAQAAGDFESLASRGLRAVRLHLGPSKIAGLDHLLSRL